MPKVGKSKPPRRDGQDSKAKIDRRTALRVGVEEPSRDAVQTALEKFFLALKTTYTASTDKTARQKGERVAQNAAAWAICPHLFPDNSIVQRARKMLECLKEEIQVQMEDPEYILDSAKAAKLWTEIRDVKVSWMSSRKNGLNGAYASSFSYRWKRRHGYANCDDRPLRDSTGTTVASPLESLTDTFSGLVLESDAGSAPNSFTTTHAPQPVISVVTPSILVTDTDGGSVGSNPVGMQSAGNSFTGSATMTYPIQPAATPDSTMTGSGDQFLGSADTGTMQYEFVGDHQQPFQSSSDLITLEFNYMVNQGWTRRAASDMVISKWIRAPPSPSR